MMEDNKCVCDIFKEQVWLFIDEALNPDELNFWKLHLDSCEECSNLLKYYLTFLKDSEVIINTDIEEIKFNQIIDNIHSNRKNNLWKKLFYRSKNTSFNTDFSVGKLALAGSLIIIAVVMILIFRSPKDIIKPYDQILNWESEKLSEEVDIVKESLLQLENESYQEKILNIYLMDDWDRSIYSIKKKIESISEELNESSL